MTDKYHRAARDGNLDMLRDATRRDCNRPDEDGMTPTLFAAYTGNLWALRLIIGRGGNPDERDLLGNTALHHAAMNGHFNCAEYLVSYGCNIWAVDNDLHSAFDGASLHDHLEIVKLLDDAMVTQLSRNKKTVERLKIKAVNDAEKNRRKFQKLQDETRRRMEKEDQRIIFKSPVEQQPSKIKLATGSLSRIFTAVKSKKDPAVTSTAPRMYSEHLSGNTKKGRTDRKVIENSNTFPVNGRSSIISSDQQVVFNQPNKRFSLSKSASYFVDNHKDAENFPTNDSGIVSDDGGSDSGLFTRPHFGNIAFLPKLFAAHHLTSIPMDNTMYSEHESPVQFAGSPSRSEDHTNYFVKDTEPTDDALDKFASLESFLTSHNLGEFLERFTSEKVDFDSMLLLTDDDLKQLDLPLGPRRKLRDAISRHIEVMNVSNIIYDTHL